jgi:4-hydroxybenzoate polyprenyltransferase
MPQLNAAAMLFGALFAMQSHLFGQLMDIDQDKNAGRRSTAILLGVRNAKLLLAAIMLLESSIAFQFFSGQLVSYFMLAGAIFFATDSQIGPTRYPLWFVKWFFIGWNVIVIITIHFIWKYGVFTLAAN